MASVAATIKTMLVEKIDALPSVQVTYKHEELNPSGFPAVCVLATGQDGEFASTSENRRIYSYRVSVLFPIGQDLEGAAGNRLDNAEDVVATVIDQIIGAIDDDFTLDGTPVLFTDAVDSDYMYTKLETGWAKTAVCTVRVHTDYILPNS